jgi:hypothetical protein
MDQQYLTNLIKLFEYYKTLGERAIGQVPEEKLNWKYNAESNSIAIIVKHMTGNMFSRFTDFLTTDGEKDWRNRDGEFENTGTSKKDLLGNWEKGWALVFDVLRELKPEDLEKTVLIRNEGLTVTDALNRQLAHYASHVGQIMFLGKMILNKEWQSLSIPRGQSGQYNAGKFTGINKDGTHFTDDLIPPFK